MSVSRQASEEKQTQMEKTVQRVRSVRTHVSVTPAWPQGANGKYTFGSLYGFDHRSILGFVSPWKKTKH